MLEIRRASPKIGAEILGADVRNLHDAAFRAVYQAFLDHVVIVLRGQRLQEQEFLDFSARFGELKVHITKKAQHPRFPNLMLMDNRVLDTRQGVRKHTPWIEQMMTISNLRLRRIETVHWEKILRLE